MLDVARNNAIAEGVYAKGFAPTLILHTPVCGSIGQSLIDEAKLFNVSLFHLKYSIDENGLLNRSGPAELIHNANKRRANPNAQISNWGTVQVGCNSSTLTTNPLDPPIWVVP